MYIQEVQSGGSTAIGESQSLGFRIDREISPTAGFSFGAEQLLHFDGLTDTGRNIYLTLSPRLYGVIMKQVNSLRYLYFWGCNR